ncbi:hypothetical protein HY463_00190 [Candidatus Peregrinibacteria bacterium]|nr:hypothetical protein [Candidatus Peregrinibacteria bacterium]
MKTIEKIKSAKLEFKLDLDKPVKEKKMHPSWYAAQGMIDDKRAKEFHAHIKQIRNEWR